MPRPSSRERQTAVEQAHVARMHARLDAETDRVRSELAHTLREQASDPTAAHARDARVAMLERRLRALDAADHGLCFGRLDTDDGQVRHIGRLGLQDGDGGGAPLLVDWRADAARPFYAATPVHPMGVHRRRHLRLEGRDVLDVSDELLDSSEPGPDDVVGDGPLLEALAARRTGRMGDVVATLQAEQDAIVRSPQRGVTVVEGGPGTGKTVVALHRAAYVLAAFDGVADAGVLVLGPNARFLDYISQVLPSLGENDVALETVATMVAGALRPDLGWSRGGAEPAEVVRAAGHPALAAALAAVVQGRQGRSGRLAVRVGSDDVLLADDELAAARERAAGSGLPHNVARGVFLAEVVEALVDAAQEQARSALERVDAETAELTGLDLDGAVASDLARLGYDGPAATDAADELDPDALRAELAEDVGVDRAVEQLWPRLTAEQVVDLLLTDVEALARLAGEVPPAERAALLRRPGSPWSEAHLPLIDEAQELVEGPPARTFGHVVVDEAQELTPMQWRSVLRRCPGRSLTVVGDLAQAGPTSRARSWADALGAEALRRADVRTLTVSYRTTVEILDATRDLLARIAPEQEVSASVRHGEKPRHVTAAREGLLDVVLREAAALARALPGGLVGVVTADAAAPEVAAALTGQGHEGVTRVVPVSQARGLEFDGVVVADPRAIETGRPGGERDLYVALTRATTLLTVVQVADPD